MILRLVSRCVRYFASVDGVAPIPPNYNAATWVLEVTGRYTVVFERALDIDWAEHYRVRRCAECDVIW